MNEGTVFCLVYYVYFVSTDNDFTSICKVQYTR
jgi:hypothetical protein